ncbi:MAG: HAD family hydrolase [Weeksellaceae bacterium]
MKYKNLIFDLDGTLWDSRKTVVLNWNEILSKHHLLQKPLSIEAMRPYMGLLAIDVLKVMLPEIFDDKINKIIREITENEAISIQQHGGILYKGVADTLKLLVQTHDLYIVSNCQDGYIEAFLKYFQMESLFKDFESHGRTGRNKAENLKLILERNRLDISETVYIGDTQTDYESTKENQLDFIFCTYGFGELSTVQDIQRIASFSELPDLVI